MTSHEKKAKKTRLKGIAQLFDRLFKLFLSFAEVAEDIVRCYTPKSVRRLVDFSHFEPAPSEHISGRFGASFCDSIYQTQLKGGRPVRLLFLFEHKSDRPTYPVHLQLLDYMLQIWENDARRNRPLSYVIAIVLYHGERPWLHEAFLKTFEGLPDVLKPYMPNFRYIAINLDEISVEEILQKPRSNYLKSLFILLKFARNLPQLWQYLPIVRAALQEKMSDERTPMLGQSISLYVVKMLEMKKIKTAEWMKNVPPQTLKAYLELIEEFGQGLAFEEEMEEIRKKWREQGLQEGLQEGRQEGRQEGIEIGAQEAKKTVVVNLLHAFPDLSDADIAKLASTSEEVVAQICQQLAEEKHDGHSNN